MVESVPAEGRSRFHHFDEGLAFRFAVNNRLSCAQAAAHHLGHKQPAAADLANETLADDVTNIFRDALTKLRLLFAREHPKNSMNGLSRIDGVERAKNQMTGFRR